MEFEFWHVKSEGWLVEIYFWVKYLFFLILNLLYPKWQQEQWLFISYIPIFVWIFFIFKLFSAFRSFLFGFQFKVRIILNLPWLLSVCELWFDNRFGETELRFGIVSTAKSLRRRVAIDSEKESICPGQTPTWAEADQHRIASATSVETIGMKEAIVFPNNSWSIGWTIKVCHSF